jgi:hypothetical protein
MATMDLVLMVNMEEAALITLKEAEAMEVVDMVIETKALAMARVAAMTVKTMELAEMALAVVVEAILEVVETTVTLAITTVILQILDS